MSLDLAIIRSQDIENFILDRFDDIFNLIASVYLAHEEGQTVNPNSYFLRFPHNQRNRIIALPAALENENKISGIKWISSFPDNIKSGLNRASAVIILNDYQTGFPLACLEGSVISAVRTACSAILAAESLHGKKICNQFGIIGNGLIARYILMSMKKRGWQIGQVNLYDLDRSASEKFKDYLPEIGYNEIKIFSSCEELLSQSDLLLFTTTSSAPYIHDLRLFVHAPTILHVSLRDIAPEIVFYSFNIVDDIEHVLSAATSVDLTYKKYQSKHFIHGTIGQLLKGNVAADNTRSRIFSPMGMGILDIALAEYIYRNISVSEKIIVKNFHPC